MKSLAILLSYLQDASSNLGADTSRDRDKILSRFQCEGLSFLTITLPTFSSWLEQSLEEGHVTDVIYCTFKKCGKSVLPCFLQGLTSRVFDKYTGDLLIDADPSAVFFIRLICSSFKKVKIPCTLARNIKAIKKFEDTDACLPEHIKLDSVTLSVAYLVLDSFNLFLQDESLPKHGKGATYEKLLGNQKYKSREFYERWLPVLSEEELYGDNYTVTRNRPLVAEEQEKPCRLSLVPKTLKSPRLIAVEPVAMQFAQQLLASRLIKGMRTSKYTKHIDFRDQANNRMQAYLGSRDRSIATIDLSEASDRISLSLVREVFQSDPDLLQALLAFRSSKIEIPSYGASPKRTIVLKKYSTSGSALTFPVETLVFFILSLSAVVRKHLGDYESLRAAVVALSQRVIVYGDDIVVPSDTCINVCQELEALGLKVNSGKTFYKGFFRESCGGDYFKGYDVTPIYIRNLLPTDVSESEKVISAVATSNLLHSRGVWLAAETIRQYIDLTIRKLPVVLPTSPGLGWYSMTSEYTRGKVLPNFHHGVKTLCSYTKAVVDSIDGYDALLKHFVSLGVSEVAGHLESSVPRFRTKLRLKWTTPY